jgi:hypothetical protein
MGVKSLFLNLSWSHRVKSKDDEMGGWGAKKRLRLPAGRQGFQIAECRLNDKNGPKSYWVIELLKKSSGHSLRKIFQHLIPSSIFSKRYLTKDKS